MIQSDAQTNELPGFWTWTNLGSISQILPGYGFPKNIQGKSSGKYPFFKVGDISRNVQAGHIYLDFCENYVDEEELKSIKGQPLPRNSIVFAKIGEALKLNRRAILKCSSLIDNNAVGVKPYDSLVNGLFVFYFLRTIKLQDFSRATTVPSVRKSDIEEIQFPLPPLAEQNQMVAKIEEVFSELDNGIENLKKAQEQLKTYRQAVLKYAFEGKLTQEWRRQQIQTGNPPEPAEKLLKQIKLERENYYKKQLEEWKKACELAEAEGKKKPAKPKEPKELPPITKKELAELPELPKGWSWARLISLSNSFGGYAFKSKHFFTSGKYQVIKIGNVRMGYMRLDHDPAFLERAEKDIIQRYGLREGDCIISLTGTRKKRDDGFVAMVKNEKNLLLNQRLGAIRFYKPLLPEFFQFALRGEHFQNKFFSHETGNVGQGNVGMKAITEETIALPPLEEQKTIVQEIESRLSVCDQLEQTIEDSLKKAEALRQSVLKKAFSGDLTKDWREKHPELITGENSAKKLLEKIKEEKYSSATSRKTPRSKKPKNMRKQENE